MIAYDSITYWGMISASAVLVYRYIQLIHFLKGSFMTGSVVVEVGLCRSGGTIRRLGAWKEGAFVLSARSERWFWYRQI